ncbi:putative DNA-binding domain-containing protein [Rhizorhabdus phycosphaerae]|uniref:HvfC/BufC family peptide modification chaperone n=1 Tax=Rhizorhabdus phycosphaerae TaxID=2711156 RepID=UPI0013ED5AB4|nr:putative DNA-binding domain-containing protein [Rhizorhabdus phycosphaerae]
MTLAEMQSAFAAFLRSGEEADAPPFGSAGLQIYLNNYRSQLIACLEASYPRTRQWIGEDAFLHAAVAHIDRVHPRSWTLDAYGHDFTETLDALFPDDPEVHDLATLERALEQAFVAADGQSMTLDAVSSIDWDAHPLVFTPSTLLLPVATNVADIWSSLVEGSEALPVVRDSGPEASLLVWRRDGESRFRSPGSGEAKALASILATRSFGALCEMLVTEQGFEAGVRSAGLLLRQWISDGIVAA